VTDWNGTNTPIADTAVSTFSGSLVRGAGETVTGSPYAISQGTLAANGNYNVTSFTGNSLTVLPTPLGIAANDASRAVNQPDPPFSASYTGLQFGETPAALTGTLNFNTTATFSSSAGLYSIIPFGQSSANYVITYVNGTLTVIGGSAPQPPIVTPQPPIVAPQPPVNAPQLPLVLVDPVTNLVIGGFQQLGAGAVYGVFWRMPD
jgi:hypothetical protein